MALSNRKAPPDQWKAILKVNKSIARVVLEVACWSVTFNIIGSSDFCGGSRCWVEAEATAVEVDGDLEVVTVSEAAGALLDGGDL
jgi:hypothetical protein